jgi:hypothetical protein
VKTRSNFDGFEGYEPNLPSLAPASIYTQIRRLRQIFPGTAFSYPRKAFNRERFVYSEGVVTRASGLVPARGRGREATRATSLRGELRVARRNTLPGLLRVETIGKLEAIEAIHKCYKYRRLESATNKAGILLILGGLQKYVDGLACEPGGQPHGFGSAATLALSRVPAPEFRRLTFGLSDKRSRNQYEE